MAAPTLIAIDQHPDRRVAVAVELWDPITLRPVTRGLTPTLAGRDDQPIVSLSGRFVWIGRHEQWPPSLTVDPGREPFEAIDQQLRQPAGWPKVDPAQRLIRVRLTPTVAYPMQGEVTCIRGDLFKSEGEGARTPVVGAQIEMQWWDRALDDWRSAGDTAKSKTDSRGNFVVFARIAPEKTQEPDQEAGYLRVRLLVTYGGERFETAAKHPFVPSPAREGRIAAAAAREFWLSLDWDHLKQLPG